jgi:hypothetical protein
MPKIMSIGIALYIVGLIDDIWGAPTFFLILGIPILIYQLILLFLIYRRKNWARIALLIFVLFLLIRSLPSYAFVVGIGHPPVGISMWAALEPLAHFSLRLIAVACLFSTAASRWFLRAPSRPLEAVSSSGSPPDSARHESSNYGFGSARSIAIGILVAVLPIGGFCAFRHSLQGSMPSEVDAKELKPGDAKYPLETASPKYVISFVVARLGLSNYRFDAEYASDVKLCGHPIGSGGYSAYAIAIPIEVAPTQDGKFHGAIAIDRFQPGQCGWKFRGIGYTRPDGVGNALGSFREKPSALALSTAPHIDMWCYHATEGQFGSPDPTCEILAELRAPSGLRRVSPEFLAGFPPEQQSARGWVPITTDTKEFTVDFHDLNAIPGALVPVGDRAAQIKVAEEASAAYDASPEGQAKQCFERANNEYARIHPRPDTATDRTQRDTVSVLEDKCRADFGLAHLDRN